MRKEPDYPMSFSAPAKHFVAHQVEVGWGKTGNLKIPICSASGQQRKNFYLSCAAYGNIMLK